MHLRCRELGGTETDFWWHDEQEAAMETVATSVEISEDDKRDVITSD
jgi:hypothetical protein